MGTQDLARTARALVPPAKGILAADESTRTLSRRFAALGIESTAETRRAYRQMLFITPGAAELISGVILFDETIRQCADDGTPAVPGIVFLSGGQTDERATLHLNMPAGQRAFHQRARCTSAARDGRYTPALDHAVA